MYDHQLLKLVQSRHKVLLRVVLVFVVLLAFLNLGGTIQGYQNRQEYMLSPSEFTATKKQAAKHHDDTFANMSYSQYQEEQKYLIAPQDKQKLYAPSFTGLVMTIVSYAIPLLVGMAMAGIDQASGLNAALFTSRFRRRQLFSVRYGYGLAYLLGATTAGIAITLLGYYAAVPAMYVGLSGANIVGALLLNLAVNSFMFTVGIGVGTIFSSPFWMGVFGLFGTWFGMSAIERFINSIRFYGPVKKSFWHMLIPSGNQLFWLLFIGAMLASVGGYFLIRWLFDRISLEHSGDVLLLPKLRWLILAYALVVIPYTFDDWILQNRLISYVVSIGMVIGLGVWWQRREHVGSQTSLKTKTV